jgi:uncharacterized protein YggU (UPF0235/DUF167 family)
MSALPWRAHAQGLDIAVRLTPRGGRDAIEGVETLSDGGAVLKARVRAAPEKGAANAALEALIAKVLGVPRSAVRVAAGAGSRLKQVRVQGDQDALASSLQRLEQT